jgi:hypothetical protein
MEHTSDMVMKVNTILFLIIMSGFGLKIFYFTRIFHHGFEAYGT